MSKLLEVRTSEVAFVRIRHVDGLSLLTLPGGMQAFIPEGHSVVVQSEPTGDSMIFSVVRDTIFDIEAGAVS